MFDLSDVACDSARGHGHAHTEDCTHALSTVVRSRQTHVAESTYTGNKSLSTRLTTPWRVGQPRQSLLRLPGLPCTSRGRCRWAALVRACDPKQGVPRHVGAPVHNANGDSTHACMHMEHIFGTAGDVRYTRARVRAPSECSAEAGRHREAARKAAQGPGPRLRVGRVVLLRDNDSPSLLFGGARHRRSCGLQGEPPSSFDASLYPGTGVHKRGRAADKKFVL